MMKTENINSTVGTVQSQNEIHLTKSDLTKVFIGWEIFTEVCLSYERLMSLGFCQAMIPAINKLYKTKEERAEAMKRHLVFFNTENNWGAFIPGLVCSLEEDRANGRDVTDELINNIKIGLMGPLAGVGDTVTQGLAKVVLLAITVNMTLEGNLFGPLIYAICYGAYILGIGIFTFKQGYYVGRNVLNKITDKAVIQKITDTLDVLGMTVAGAMIFTHASINSSAVWEINGSEVVLNDILEGIIPNFLGVVTTLLVFWRIKKGDPINKIVIGLIIIGFALSLLGIL